MNDHLLYEAVKPVRWYIEREMTKKYLQIDLIFFFISISVQDKNKSVKKNNFDDLVNVPGPSDITAYKLDINRGSIDASTPLHHTSVGFTQLNQQGFQYCTIGTQGNNATFERNSARQAERMSSEWNLHPQTFTRSTFNTSTDESETSLSLEISEGDRRGTPNMNMSTKFPFCPEFNHSDSESSNNNVIKEESTHWNKGRSSGEAIDGRQWLTKQSNKNHSHFDLPLNKKEGLARFIIRESLQKSGTRIHTERKEMANESPMLMVTPDNQMNPNSDDDLTKPFCGNYSKNQNNGGVRETPPNKSNNFSKMPSDMMVDAVLRHLEMMENENENDITDAGEIKDEQEEGSPGEDQSKQTCSSNSTSSPSNGMDLDSEENMEVLLEKIIRNAAVLARGNNDDNAATGVEALRLPQNNKIFNSVRDFEDKDRTAATTSLQNKGAAFASAFTAKALTSGAGVNAVQHNGTPKTSHNQKIFKPYNVPKKTVRVFQTSQETEQKDCTEFNQVADRAREREKLSTVDQKLCSDDGQQDNVFQPKFIHPTMVNAFAFLTYIDHCC